MKNKIPLMFAFLFLIPIATALELPCDHEYNITAFNTTNNMTYNLSITSTCDVSQCRINLTLEPNQTFSETTSPCDVYMDVLPCNITNETIIRRCVMENMTFELDFGTNRTFANYTDECSVNFTMSCGEMPENTTIVDIDRLLRMQETTEKCVGLLETYTEENMTYLMYEFSDILSEKEMELREKEQFIRSRKLCTINDTALIFGWEELPNMYRTKLRTFSRLTQPVDIWDFTALAFPTENNTGLVWNSYWMLEEYTRLGFAEAVCETTARSIYARCRYMPVIIEPCLDRLPELLEIKSVGWAGGFMLMFWILVIAIAIIMISLFLYLRWTPIAKV